MKTITLGMVGTGRATELHMNAYNKVSGVNIRFKSIYNHHLEKSFVAKEVYGFESVANTIDDMLADSEIDVIDICTPPYSHKEIVISALNAGKHVICEKPICGYFGPGVTNKTQMLESVKNDLKEIEEAINNSNRFFFYAENYIYAPSIIKAAEIIKAKNSKILYAKGEESLAGSSSPVAGNWANTGGGTLIRIGCHPLSAIIWLKRQENGSKVESVLSDFARVTANLSDYDHRYIKSRPVDVEDTATVCLTFSDGTKSTVIACDSHIGGSKNSLELYCNDAVINCNLTMNSSMSTYFLDEDGIENVEISEMLSSKCGWNNPFISDEIMRGYVGEMQDFMECIIYNRKPVSNFELAKETIITIYKAYEFFDS